MFLSSQLFYNILFGPKHDTFLAFSHDLLAVDDRQCFVVRLIQPIRIDASAHLKKD